MPFFSLPASFKLNLTKWNDVSPASITETPLGIAYGNGRWVIVGTPDGTDPTILTSDNNGASWTERANPGESYVTLRDVLWDGSQFLAVGNDATCLTSPNGTTWTARTTAGSAIADFRGIAFDGTTHVIVGGQDGTDAMINSSTNGGVSWTERANPKNFRLGAIAHGNGTWVAVGDPDGTDAYIVTSTNIVTWTERSNPKNVTLYDVAYGAGIFVAVGARDGTDAYIITSSDGTTWTERSNPLTSALHQATNSIIYAFGRFIAVGDNATTETSLSIITSPDGITWTQHNGDHDLDIGSMGFNAIAAGSRKLMMVGNDPSDLLVGISPG